MEIAKGLVIAGTGHRPDKLGGYDQTTSNRLVDLATAALKTCGPKKVITGMALGWDQALAIACGHLSIPYTAAVLFKGQEGRWSSGQQELYRLLLDAAAEVIYVSDPGFTAAKMQKRNEWMVDHSDAVLALWNGSAGGTANCVRYAQSMHVPVINLWSSWVKFR